MYNRRARKGFVVERKLFEPGYTRVSIFRVEMVSFRHQLTPRNDFQRGPAISCPLAPIAAHACKSIGVFSKTVSLMTVENLHLLFGGHMQQLSLKSATLVTVRQREDPTEEIGKTKALRQKVDDYDPVKLSCSEL